jgi:tRNA pseudouridine38-40 synthase
MALYKSIIAYDGTDFQGFQRQRAHQRTVQGVLEDGLRSIGWSGRGVQAAGRTDAGVHARGQVVAFEMRWRHACEDLTRALNANLPADVAVWDTAEAPGGFHPRKSAVRRRYSYTLTLDPHRRPLRERYAWRVWPTPDLDLMQRTATAFVGRHDFRAFGSPPRPESDSRRRVFACEWEQKESTCWLEIVGDAFLKHMVRRMVAAMISVGRNRTTLEEVRSLLDRPELRWEGVIAPGRGLCLEQVIYPEPPAGDR